MKKLITTYLKSVTQENWRSHYFQQATLSMTDVRGNFINVSLSNPKTPSIMAKMTRGDVSKMIRILRKTKREMFRIGVKNFIIRKLTWLKNFSIKIFIISKNFIKKAIGKKNESR